MGLLEKLPDYDDGSLDDLFLELHRRLNEQEHFSRAETMACFENLLHVILVNCFSSSPDDEVRKKLRDYICGDIAELLQAAKDFRGDRDDQTILNEIPGEEPDEPRG